MNLDYFPTCLNNRFMLDFGNHNHLTLLEECPKNEGDGFAEPSHHLHYLEPFSPPYQRPQAEGVLPARKKKSAANAGL